MRIKHIKHVRKNKNRTGSFIKNSFLLMFFCLLFMFFSSTKELVQINTDKWKNSSVIPHYKSVIKHIPKKNKGFIFLIFCFAIFLVGLLYYLLCGCGRCHCCFRIRRDDEFELQADTAIEDPSKNEEEEEDCYNGEATLIIAKVMPVR